MKLIRFALLILFLGAIGIGVYEVILEKILFNDVYKIEQSDSFFSRDFTTFSKYEYRVHYLSLIMASWYSFLSSLFFIKLDQFLELKFRMLRGLLFVFGLLFSWIIAGMLYIEFYKSVAYSVFRIPFICVLPGISVTLIPLITFISIWLFVNKIGLSKIRTVKKNTKFSLEQIKIASPCPASWEEMIGDDTVRFCRICSKNVYNLSSMSKAEAQTLVMNNHGKLCGLLYLRKDGSVMTSDCPVGFGEIRRRAIKRIAKIAGAAFAFIGLQLFFVGDRSSKHKLKVQDEEPQHTTREEFDRQELKTLTGLAYIDE